MTAFWTELWDLSRPLRSGLPVYPGDPLVEFEERVTPTDGGECRLTALRLGTHSGTHVDAPRHMLREGATVTDLCWEALLGPALLVDAPPGSEVAVDFLRGLDLPPRARLLLRTLPPGAPLPPGFPEAWTALGADAAAYLAGRKLLLLGVDVPSVDPLGSPEAPAHRALLSAGVVLLEGLDLSAPAAGEYQLVCLPLPLVGLDGAPCRAVLLR